MGVNHPTQGRGARAQVGTQSMLPTRWQAKCDPLGLAGPRRPTKAPASASHAKMLRIVDATRARRDLRLLNLKRELSRDSMGHTRIMVRKDRIYDAPNLVEISKVRSRHRCRGVRPYAEGAPSDPDDGGLPPFDLLAPGPSPGWHGHQGRRTQRAAVAARTGRPRSSTADPRVGSTPQP